MKKLLILLALAAPVAHAWDGYDWDNNADIEFESVQTVREGNTVEIFDYKAGAYREVQVESIDNYGLGTEVEVYDYTTGEYRTFEMED